MLGPQELLKLGKLRHGVREEGLGGLFLRLWLVRHRGLAAVLSPPSYGSQL